MDEKNSKKKGVKLNKYPIVDLDLDKITPKATIGNALSGIGEAVKASMRFSEHFDRLNSMSSVERIADLLPTVKPVEIDSSWIAGDAKRKAEEAEIRRLTLKTLKAGQPNNVLPLKKGNEIGNSNWYMPEIGVGYINGRKFRFVKNKKTHILFNAVFKNSNQLPRNEVIKILNLHSEDSENERVINTYEINESVKAIRKSTKLTKEEFINNGGDITISIKIQDRKVP